MTVRTELAVGLRSAHRVGRVERRLGCRTRRGAPPSRTRRAVRRRGRGRRACRDGCRGTRTVAAAPRGLAPSRSRAAVGQHFALVDPDLDADAAEGGERFDVRVVDVGAQRVQRHLAVEVALDARDLRAAQAAADTCTLTPRAPAFMVRMIACFMARRNAMRFSSWSTMLLADQLRVELGMLDLDDVDLDLLAA